MSQRKQISPHKPYGSKRYIPYCKQIGSLSYFLSQIIEFYYLHFFFYRKREDTQSQIAPGRLCTASRPFLGRRIKSYCEVLWDEYKIYIPTRRFNLKRRYDHKSCSLRVGQILAFLKAMQLFTGKSFRVKSSDTITFIRIRISPASYQWFNNVPFLRAVSLQNVVNHGHPHLPVCCHSK